MEEAGLDALPIVCFLSFFIGLVIAFIGANLLAMFNASVFTVELVGIGMLREFGAVLTAILLAGRTDQRLHRSDRRDEDAPGDRCDAHHRPRPDGGDRRPAPDRARCS